jgi:hypothetical protein
MIDRLISLVVALSLALLVWLYARSRDQEVLDNVPIPVQITLPPGQDKHYSLEVDGPSTVPMSFSGPPARIRDLRGMLQRGELQVHVIFPVPEGHPEDSHYLDRYLDTVRVNVADVHAPPGVTALIVEARNRIPVTLYRLVERRLPVHVDSGLEARTGQFTLEPASVLVRGPQEVLDRARFIKTQPVRLPAIGDQPTNRALSLGPVQLAAEIEGRAIHATPGAVMVRWAPKSRIYELRVPVQFLCPANLGLRPKFSGDGRGGDITVRVQGPDAPEEPKVFAYIDLTRGNFLAGLNHESVQLQLPRDFQLAQDPPRSVTFELVATEPASRGPSGFRKP